MWVRRALLSGGLILTAAGPLSAQGRSGPVWDAPAILPPGPGDDLAIYLIDPIRADWALAGIWRQGGDLNLTVDLGVDLRIDEALLLPFGAAIGDHDAIGVGLAFRVGRRVMTC